MNRLITGKVPDAAIDLAVLAYVMNRPSDRGRIAYYLSQAIEVTPDSVGDSLKRLKAHGRVVYAKDHPRSRKLWRYVSPVEVSQ